MNNEIKYPKRLIEVDFPIKKISEHSVHDKSIKKGHIQRLHIWWARRPLASCRATTLATILWDPADSRCSEEYRMGIIDILRPLENQNNLNDIELRKLLLDFICEISQWENSNNKDLVEKAKKLIKLTNNENNQLLLVDPFSGGGAFPLEFNRFGLDTFAMDINSVSYILLKSVLIDLPKYGDRLIYDVEKWGEWIKSQSRKDSEVYYPSKNSKFVPFVYFWARTIKCESPNCGTEIPMIKNMLLSKKEKISIEFKILKESNQIDFHLNKIDNVNEVSNGSLRRGSVTCPICDFTMKQRVVEKQVNQSGTGIKLLAILFINPSTKEKQFKLPTENDLNAYLNSKKRLEDLKKEITTMSLLPDEPVPNFRTYWSIYLYGIRTWGELFSDRQALSLSLFVKYIKEVHYKSINTDGDLDYTRALITILAISFSNMTQYNSTLSNYVLDHMVSAFIHGGLGMKFDFAEVNPHFKDYVGTFDYSLKNTIEVIKNNSNTQNSVTIVNGSARNIPLPDSSAFAVITDPPYYDAYPYADLSDFFYVWLKRIIGDYYPDIFSQNLSEKKEEIVQMAGRNDMYQHKTKEWFEEKMKECLIEARRILSKDGLLVIVFAHKTTEGWEAMINAIIKAGWVITASWPIKTERAARMRAHGSAVLGSSIHLVCRPRISASVGDWREILNILPNKIHSWMLRLADDGIVGADAIFSCIGPALEIFSQFSQVEKASGDIVTLNEYLEHVWAAVSKEALNMIFEGADATGFEEDARITSMWLWTLSTGENELEQRENDDLKDSSKIVKSSGFILEYDAVRKIAQGLGAHLEELTNLVEIKGNKAKLLLVSERAKYLFGKEQIKVKKKSAKKDKQVTLWGGITEKETEELTIDGFAEPGKTVLDQVHQSMLLFAEGKSEALKRLIIEDGVGNDPRFWKLAQALSALYPKNTEEKRWVDGVMGRKKSLGF